MALAVHRVICRVTPARFEANFYKRTSLTLLENTHDCGFGRGFGIFIFDCEESQKIRHFRQFVRVSRRSVSCFSTRNTWMKIGIVGAGAVGLYYGARLQRLGEDVFFLLRSDFEAISENGIRVRASDGNFRLESVKGYRNSAEIGLVDLVIVALKATANADLPGLLAPLVGPGTSILTLQNGLGGDEELAKLFPGNRILGGLCFTCLHRVDPGVVENYLLGSVSLGECGGPASEQTRQIGELLNRSGANCRVTDDLKLMQWKKLVWNVPFNGLSIAAGGVSTDVIVSDSGLSRLARGLMEEIIDIAAALGMEIESDFMDEQFALTRSMGEYKPSSLVDYLAGRTVEVDAIWGEPLRLGIEAGLDLPKLETLYRLLRLACKNRTSA